MIEVNVGDLVLIGETLNEHIINFGMVVSRNGSQFRIQWFDNGNIYQYAGWQVEVWKQRFDLAKENL